MYEVSVNESAIVETLRRRQTLRYRIQHAKLRAFQIAAILSAGCVVWALRSTLLSSLLWAGSRLSALKQHLLSLRF